MAAKSSLFVVAAMFVVGCLTVGHALECYQCSNVETDGSNSFLRELFKGNSDPNCASASTSPSGQCPSDYGYKCGYADVKVTQNVVVGKISYKIQTRQCVQTSLDNGCYTSDEDVEDIANNILSTLTGVEVDGKVCYCSDDLCDAECGGNYWLIEEWCAPKWAVVIIGIIMLIVAGLLLSCCCCCCCCGGCCCCRKTPSGQVIMTQTPMMTSTTVAYAPAGQAPGVQGMENPGYNLTYPPPQAAGTVAPPDYSYSDGKKHGIV